MNGSFGFHWHRFIGPASLLLLWLCPATAECHGQEALRAWVLTGPDRARRSAKPKQNRAAKIEAARNEWVFFQISVRARQPVRDLSLTMSPLQGPDGARLHGHDNVRLYREHALHIRTPSPRGAKFTPGWFPDALIPFKNPANGSSLPDARLQAIPFALPANETHTFLVELYVPAQARAGRYNGRATFRWKSRGRMEIPVELTVWDFALPRLAAMKTEFGSPIGAMMNRLSKRKPQNRALLDSTITHCAQLTTEHRLNSVLPFARDYALIKRIMNADGALEFSREHIAKWKAFANRFHVNALSVYRPSDYFRTTERDKIVRYLRSWDRFLQQTGTTHVLCYTYLRDEPNDRKSYDWVRRWGKAIRAARTGVKVLVTEQTKTQNEQWGHLHGAVDIWVPLFPHFQPKYAAQRRRQGELIWTYTALAQSNPPTPWWQTDRPLLNYRASCWIAWRYNITGLLYWGELAYWKSVRDPWTQSATYGEFHGEGNLTYPGMDVGYDGLLPSLRLKVLRSGIQDYDYLHILERRGLRQKAMEIVKRVGSGWDTWSRDPQAYLSARRALARLILNSQPTRMPR